MSKGTIKTVAMGVAISVLGLVVYDAVRPYLRQYGIVS